MKKGKTTGRRKNPVRNPVARTMPGRNGGTLRRGGTNRGGPGRPANEFFEQARAAALDDVLPRVLGYIRSSTEPSHVESRAFRWASEFVSHYGLGRPVDRAVISSAALSHEEWLDQLDEVESPRERIEAKLQRLAAAQQTAKGSEIPPTPPAAVNEALATSSVAPADVPQTPRSVPVPVPVPVAMPTRGESWSI